MFNIEIPTFIFTILNFLVLFWLLKKFLFKPVTEYMEKRSRLIKDSLEEARKEREEALRLKEEYERKLESVSAESERILNSAKEKAESEYREIIMAARKEMEAMKEEAGKSLEEKRAVLIEDLKLEITDLILMAAEKVIEENMDDEKNRRLVAGFINARGL